MKKRILALLMAVCLVVGLIPGSAFASQNVLENNANTADILRKAFGIYGGHTYALFDGVASTWNEAKEYCESLGGHLVTITSAEENAFLYNYMQKCGYANAYWGLTDYAVEGVWEWCTGESVTYLNWASGEPNNDYDGTEDYGMFWDERPGGYWNDGVFGHDGQAFLCEWDCILPEAQAVYNDHAYMLMAADISTWEEAQAYCESLGGHLATITSAEENDFLTSLTNNSDKKYYWIGLSRKDDLMHWKWITDEAVVYTNWDAGEPNNTGNHQEYYAHMYADNGKWNDTANEPYEYAPDFGFICEWENPPAASTAHDTVAELTEEDYMLFAELAYKDLSSALGDPTANPVKEPKTIGEFYANKWDKKWSTYDLTYGQVFGSIANWYPASTHSTYLGYQDVVFCNASGDVVIAYRGSDNITEVLTDPNSFGDWVINDLQSEIFSRALPQIDDALETYTMVAASTDPARIAVTGHSLGGALADVVAAYSGSKGVSFNAISALDVAYGTKPLWMAKNFEGVNRWSFVDHANEYDILAGTFEEQFYSTRIKPYVAHKSLCGKDALADVADNHGLHSYLTTDSTGALALTAQTGKYIPDEPITHFSSPLLAGKFKLELGTSGNDFFGSCLNEKKLYSVSFGGNGYDQIWTGAKNDYLAGGNGQDLLDGSWGNDTYIYYKGDGMDYINDVGGRDNLYLLGFDDNDVIGVLEQDYLYITCNNEKIIGIKTEGREYEWFTSDAFTVMRQKENGSTVPFDITNYFKPSVYKSRILVGCPVGVEVIDPNGNVVHTLTDGEVGIWYTDYGNFYVFEEENGEYGKVLDLIEGYTARIVGTGEGTMDVTYQVPVDGELTEPVFVYDVPVTEALVAAIEENEEGDIYLIVDADGDGETDSEKKFYGECPFTDVPSDSFYYEPVLWALENNITTGATETTFNPTGDCLRAQVVTFLWRAAGEPKPTSTHNPFVDVKPSDFYYDAVLWAVENGITNGADATHFNPMGVCNRAQVVTFLYRAFHSPDVENESNPFTDVPAGTWYADPVLWAVENGITNGLSATEFGPNANCNRAQIVTFLYRAYN